MASRAARLIGIAGAHLHLRSLLNELRRSPEVRDVVRASTRWRGGFIASMQIEDEIVALVSDVRELAPKTVIEIGTAQGGTLLLWSLFSAPDATLVSIDLPHGAFGGGYPRTHASLFRRFAARGQHLHLLRADSHEPETVEKVRALLKGRSVDFLFIDGDHSYAGVQRDFGLYAPLVRRGGLIAFHDIASDYEDTQVHRFWTEVRSTAPHAEFINDPGGQFGIGVLRM